MRLSELQRRFDGKIYQDRKRDWYQVIYSGSNKLYRYYAPTIRSLAERLGVITRDEAVREAGFAGACPRCGGGYRDGEWRCGNCGALIRQPTREELRREEEEEKDWR